MLRSAWAMSKIKVDQLDSMMMDIYNEYVKACEKEADDTVKLTAKEAAEELKHAHPAGSGQYGPWTAYNKGWTVMQTARDKREHKVATVHNKDHYRLTHLLEHGHALPQGGRSQAYVHIAPVAEKCEEKLMQRMIRGL